MPTIENIGRPAPVAIEPVVVAAPPARPMSVPTAAALKMGVGFPLTNLPGTNEDPNRILSTQCQNNSKMMHDCGICKRCNDQHMLAKCDTCHLHYHLGCLNPPLTRHPKKSKLYGWQCSECVKSDDSDAAVTLPVGPRKSRTKYSKDGTIVPVDPPSMTIIPPTDGVATVVAPPAPQPPAAPNTIIDLSSDDTNVDTALAKVTPKSPRPTVRKAEKRSISETIEKIEEVLVPIPDVNRSIKRKKVKKSATVANDDSLLGGDASEVADTGDPLDISNTEIIIIPKSTALDNGAQVTTDSIHKMGNNIGTGHKVKSNKKMKRDKSATNNSSSSKSHQNHHDSTKPTYYIDQNGILNSIDSIPKVGHFTSELIPGNATSNGGTELNDLHHKQNRKRRKEKHRNKHGDDSDRLSTKEHKKKRKKKNHDMENPNNNGASTEGIPRIKIKVGI